MAKLGKIGDAKLPDDLSAWVDGEGQVVVCTDYDKPLPFKASYVPVKFQDKRLFEQEFPIRWEGGDLIIDFKLFHYVLYRGQT